LLRATSEGRFLFVGALLVPHILLGVVLRGEDGKLMPIDAPN
jgi:hypothetical protein